MAIAFYYEEVAKHSVLYKVSVVGIIDNFPDINIMGMTEDNKKFW